MNQCAGSLETHAKDVHKQYDERLCLFVGPLLHSVFVDSATFPVGVSERGAVYAVTGA